jgi:ABC-type nitrate/sulfonate/bicarbonate transport system substrate-binding protein
MAGAAHAQAKQPDPINFVLTRNVQGLSVQVGLEKGIFDKYNLDLQVSVVSAGQDSVKAVQAGSSQFGLVSFEIGMSGIAAGVPLTYIDMLSGDSRVVNTDDFYAIVARKEANAKSMADLKGKTVGLTLGTTMETLLKGYLADAKMVDGDINKVNVTVTNSVTALSSVDAVIASEPYVQLILRGFPGSNVVKRGGGFIPQRTATVVRSDWLEKNRDVAMRAVLATVESQQYTRQHLAEAAAIGARWLGPPLDPEITQKALAFVQFDPRMSPQVKKSWDDVSKSLVASGRMKTEVPWEKGWDTSMIDKVLKDRPELLSDLPK